MGAMNGVLMFLMFFPLFVALYIIGAAVHEAGSAYFRFHLWPKWKACFWRSLHRLKRWADPASSAGWVDPALAKERADFFRSIERERPAAAIPTSVRVRVRGRVRGRVRARVRVRDRVSPNPNPNPNPNQELRALSLPEHTSVQCPLCDRMYMLRNGCPCMQGATRDPGDPPPAPV